ncbi:MAG: NADPH-dependent 7-cyano-7-deazaguanine reductase QueF, partial [Pseudomonadales bacterium]
MSENPLGEKVPQPSKYDPSILYPIPRWPARSLLDIDKKLRMFGFDHWHAYELGWLDDSGKPRVATGEFFFDSDSENIVES